MDKKSTLEKDSNWSRLRKFIPERPTNMLSPDKDDADYWYDFEYAGWHVEKVNIPKSPLDGIKNKNIHYFLPGNHPYIDEYAVTLYDLAKAYDVKLTTFNANWDYSLQKFHVEKSIRNPPDMMVILPVNLELSTELYKKVNSHGVPVIAGNFLPQDEGFKYIVAWSGPDDWYQFRLLSRKLAEILNFEGGYCIIRHMPGTSSYYARTYSVITELKKIAPDMNLLDMNSVNIEDKNETKNIVMDWIKQYGKNLKGIVSADDCYVQMGINEAIDKTHRHDIVRVSAGSSEYGLDCVKKGTLHAITYQSASIDAATSFKLAADWFEGLLIEPIRYLPVNIITKDNIDDFTSEDISLESIDPYDLFLSILSYDSKDVEKFFENLFNKIIHSKHIPSEQLNGFLLEIIAVLLRIVRENDLLITKLFDSYEYLYKRLFNQISVLKSVLWLEHLSNLIILKLKSNESKNEKLVSKLLDHIKKNYSEPMSLKTLSSRFNRSAGYLGQLIKKETGVCFNDYINQMRIEKARELLKNTSMNARQISEKVGFENPDYFYYVFKKYTGHFPSQYL